MLPDSVGCCLLPPFRLLSRIRQTDNLKGKSAVLVSSEPKAVAHDDVRDCVSSDDTNSWEALRARSRRLAACCLVAGEE